MAATREGFDADLVIVGAGPVGATLALLAAQAGLSVILADRAPAIHPLPRAAHVDHEVMRVFQAVGAAPAILATSRSTAEYDFLTASGALLMRVGGGDRIGPGGWPAANMIHQPSLEAALRDRFASTPTLRLALEWTLEDLTLGEGVRAVFATPDGPRALNARHLVGCDGARSRVREVMGVDLDDLDFDEPWLVVDALVHDAARLPDRNLQICDPARPTTCVVMGAGRHRWEFMLRPGESPERMMDDAVIADLLAPWKVDGAISIERKAVYRFHALVARTWRRGPVFLAGDAAHQTPPFAGQGLCTGVRDAANLAWKLAAVHHGLAADGLLDTYQVEREPQTRAVIDVALNMGRLVCVTDPAAAAARDAAMLAARAADAGGPADRPTAPIAQGVVLAGAPLAGAYFPQPIIERDGTAARLDDALGPGAWLLRRDGPAPRVPRSVADHPLSDPVVSPFAPALDALLARAGAPAVLVRPDRYIFGAGEAADLAARWAEALGGPQGHYVS